MSGSGSDLQIVRNKLAFNNIHNYSRLGGDCKVLVNKPGTRGRFKKGFQILIDGLDGRTRYGSNIQAIMLYDVCTKKYGNGNGNVQLFCFINSSCVFLRPFEKTSVALWRRIEFSITFHDKKLAGSPALLEDKKHKEIAVLFLFFR